MSNETLQTHGPNDVELNFLEQHIEALRVIEKNASVFLQRMHQVGKAYKAAGEFIAYPEDAKPEMTELYADDIKLFYYDGDGGDDSLRLSIQRFLHDSPAELLRYFSAEREIRLEAQRELNKLWQAEKNRQIDAEERAVYERLKKKFGQ